MRVRELSILGRVAAIMLAGALSACASSGVPLSPPQLLAEQPPLKASKNSTAPVDAPTDVASLPDQQQDISDPYEKMNRSVFKANERFNHAVLYPMAEAYDNNVPESVRTGIQNFATNLGEPLVFANDVLQLRPQAAATTLGRFAFNSTIGIGGVFDVATPRDMPHQSGDFGQTLYVWGMRDTKYLVVPVIGPTNVRDLFGTAVEFAATIPVGGFLQTELAARYTTQVANTANNLTVMGSVATPVAQLDQVGEMQALEDSSLDFYTMLRSVADQKRQAELNEALQTSGWTAGFGSSPPAPDVTVAAVPSPIPHPGPVGGDQDLLANIPIAR